MIFRLGLLDPVLCSRFTMGFLGYWLRRRWMAFVRGTNPEDRTLLGPSSGDSCISLVHEIYRCNFSKSRNDKLKNGQQHTAATRRMVKPCVSVLNWDVSYVFPWKRFFFRFPVSGQWRILIGKIFVGNWTLINVRIAAKRSFFFRILCCQLGRLGLFLLRHLAR